MKDSFYSPRDIIIRSIEARFTELNKTERDFGVCFKIVHTREFNKHDLVGADFKGR